MERNQKALDILLVDDNEDDVFFVKKAFKHARLVNVLTVLSDGEQAIQYLKKEEPYADSVMPDLILLDINMPKVNGFEVLEYIKSQKHLLSLPVVMLTTSERDEDIIKSYESGACSYIQKPVDFNKMVEVAERFEFYWCLTTKLPRS
ncbi:MAG: response regulator [Verrucomicrobiota bacterium]